MMRLQGSITIMRFLTGSRTSTGAIPMLRDAVYEAMRFWMRRGVDAFGRTGLSGI